MTTERTFPEAPATVPGASSASVSVPTVSLWRRLAKPGYLVGSAPMLALFALLVQVVVASVAATLTASLVGLVLLPLAAIAFAYVERWRLEKLGFGRVADGHLRFSGDGFWEQVSFRYREVATWRETGSLLVAMLLGSIAGVLLLLELALLVALSATSVAMLMGHPLFVNMPGDGDGVALVTTPLPAGQQAYEVDPGFWWLALLLTFVVGAVFMYVNGVLAAAGASLSKLILSPRAEEYARQAESLQASRLKIVDAFEGERRRIERNLHDGVQQELVNLNLRLGLAEMEAKNLAAGDGRAEAVLNHVREARGQLAHAQMTLRDTVRGIYPAVLEDHGLGAALEDLARHSVLPLELTYELADRLPRDVERTAYYTVTEVLANTNKHAQAQKLAVAVRLEGSSLVVTAEDDGRGGADLQRGTGLAGLVERAATLGGSIQVDSPVGGPTHLKLVLPLDTTA